MKFSAVFFTQLLAWRVAALALPAQDNGNVADVMQARATPAPEFDIDQDINERGILDLFKKKKKTTAKPDNNTPSTTTQATTTTQTASPSLTPMEKELVEANKKGVSAFDVPKPPSEGQKVSKRSSRKVRSANLHRRKDDEADMNDISTGTASDTVWTQGLAPCTGIIATFPGVSSGKINKIAVHIGAAGGQAAITKFTKAVYDAAVEGGVWDTDLDEGHRPEISISYPDVSAEVARMVKDGDIQEKDRSGMEGTLKKVNANIETAMSSLCSATGGSCNPKTRSGVKPTGSKMSTDQAGNVNVDGIPF